jgi:hypothetical protein
VCEIEAFRFPSNDPFVDSVKFGIGALARDGPGVIDFIARFEESGVGTDLLHDAGGVPSEDLVLLFFGSNSHPNLYINRIDGDRSNLHQQVTMRCNRDRELDIQQRGWIFDWE